MDVVPTMTALAASASVPASSTETNALCTTSSMCRSLWVDIPEISALSWNGSTTGAGVSHIRIEVAI
ncbi:MAG: hypothetical protein ABR886_06795 [Dehalococcoidales bacterium]